MGVILHREFATAEDTAAALGVSKRRLKRLLKIAGPTPKDLVRLHFKRSVNGNLATMPGKVSGKNGRKKPTRGKAKKSTR